MVGCDMTTLLPAGARRVLVAGSVCRGRSCVEAESALRFPLAPFALVWCVQVAKCSVAVVTDFGENSHEVQVILKHVAASK